MKQCLFYPRANGAKRRSGRKPGVRVTNSARLFTPREKRTQRMMSQPAPGSQLQVREPGASSSYNFKMELERLVFKQTAFAA